MGTGRYVHIAVALTTAILAFGGCGGEDSTSSQTVAVENGSDDSAGGEIYARSAQLQEGSRATLLQTPVADVTVLCKGDGDAFVGVKSKGSTTYGVVSSTEGQTIQPKLDPGETVGVPISVPSNQTWTLAPFSEGGAQPTAITVGVSDAQPSASTYDCAVSAFAVVGAPGATLTQ